MKKVVRDFFIRGLVASGFGPLVLAACYLLIGHRFGVQTLTVDEVCLGIVSLWALAFIAGGMNAIYQVERLPLMLAILLHGGVLYLSYLGTYLINGWMEWGKTPILVFTVIFVLGYLAVWAVIYAINKRKTQKLNEMLKQKQHQNPGP